MSSYITFGVIDVMRLRFGMETGCVGSHSLTWIKDGRQHFVINVDKAESLLGNFRCFGSHSSDAVSHKTHDVVQAILIIRTRCGRCLSSRDIRNTLDILVSQDSMDAGEATSF